jgi:hypothetical protein
VVELGIVERASDSTIGRVLKKLVTAQVLGAWVKPIGGIGAGLADPE